MDNLQEKMNSEREDNLKKGVMEIFKINDATKEEIIKVCNQILKKLKWGLE